MSRVSRRIKNKIDSTTLEYHEVLTLSDKRQPTGNKMGKRKTKSRDAEKSSSSPLKSPKTKGRKIENNQAGDPSETITNTNDNASVAENTNTRQSDVNASIKDNRIVQLNQKEQDATVLSQKSGETINNEEIQFESCTDDIQMDDEEQHEVVRNTKSKSKSTPQTPKRPKAAVRIPTNQDLTDQMEKLSKELAAVKEQLKEKEDKEKQTNSQNRAGNVHKVHSDTTIYAPAVLHNDEIIPEGVVANKLRSKQNSRVNSPANKSQVQANNVQLEIDMQNKANDTAKVIESCVNKLLNEIRIGTSGVGARPKDVHRRLDFGRSCEPPQEKDTESDDERYRRLARERVIEAEKYKANIEIPKGKDNQNINQCPRVEDTDDEFIHITCHVDQGLIDKVEDKQFVELDPFVPKMDLHNFDPEQKLEMVQRGGDVFWRPHIDKKQKITNLHTWDQAFRVYMAIYTRKYPNEAPEMTQYVHTIHHAAAKYTWENVAYYDYTFRKNMAKNKTRSWAKTFEHMWNIALCDPLRNNGNNGNSGGGNGTKPPNSAKKPCWRFNKGHCPYGQNCRFLHKCTFCGGTSHGAHACFKKNGRKGDKPTGDKQRKRRLLILPYLNCLPNNIIVTILDCRLMVSSEKTAGFVC